MVCCGEAKASILEGRRLEVAVYGCESMGTDVLSVRASDKLLAEVEAYSETHDITRSEAARRLIEYAVGESPPPEPGEDERDWSNRRESVFLLELEPETAEHFAEIAKESDHTPAEKMAMLLRQSKAGWL
jgi:hypothetical protein